MRDRLERLYREHRQGLFTLALAITRCPNRAEDAVHESFARLWESSARPSDPVPYAYAAVRHAAIDLARRAAAQAKAETASIYNGSAGTAGVGILATDTEPGPDEDAITAEQQRRIRQAVDALPDAEREAIVLRIYAGLKFEQMAEVLGEPLPTVASRYRRALETLSRRIQGMVEVPRE